MVRIDVTNVLFLDIETVCGVKTFEELNPNMQVLWAHKASKIERREVEPEEISTLYKDRAAIYAEFGKSFVSRLELSIETKKENFSFV